MLTIFNFALALCLQCPVSTYSPDSVIIVSASAAQHKKSIFTVLVPGIKKPITLSLVGIETDELNAAQMTLFKLTQAEFKTLSRLGTKISDVTIKKDGIPMPGTISLRSYGQNGQNGQIRRLVISTGGFVIR